VSELIPTDELITMALVLESIVVFFQKGEEDLSSAWKFPNMICFIVDSTRIIYRVKLS
jgi:hypothetical protein